MAVMKDIAKLAGVSVSTVSLVLNGAGKKYKISEATIMRVNKAARELGYHVNLSVAGENPHRRTIAIYQAMESTWSDLGTVAESIYQHMKARKVNYDVLIMPYTAGALITALALTDWSTVDAAIVISAHEQDMKAIAESEERYPLVLFNRLMEGYDSVLCSAQNSIERTISMIQARGYESLAVIAGNGKPKIGDEHFSQLLCHCRACGINIDEHHTIFTDNTLQGGAVAARRLLNMESVPQLILCMNTTLAFGAIPFLARNKVYIPLNSELLCFAWDSELDYMKNYIPALSAISFPVEEMMRHALELAMQVAQGHEREVAHYRCESALVLNESFTV